MKRLLLSVLNLGECALLGAMMTLLPLGLVGAIKEFIYGGTSDGILFDVIMFGFPLWIVAPFVIASRCAIKPRFRKGCRLVTYSYFALGVLTALIRASEG
jgi:hypothetical protein